MRALKNDHVLDGRTMFSGLIDDLLELDLAPPAIAAVGGDDDLTSAVIDAVADGVRRKSGKDHSVRRPDAGTGEHGDGQGRDKRHIQGHAIAGLYAEALEHVGKPRDFLMQLKVRDGLDLAGLAFPNDRCLVAPPGRKVPIEAVVGNIDLAADKPLGVRFLPVEYAVPLAKPMQFLGLLCPKALRVGCGISIKLFVFRKTLNMSIGRKFRGRRKKP